MRTMKFINWLHSLVGILAGKFKTLSTAAFVVNFALLQVCPPFFFSNPNNIYSLQFFFNFGANTTTYVSLKPQLLSSHPHLNTSILSPSSATPQNSFPPVSKASLMVSPPHQEKLVPLSQRSLSMRSQRKSVLQSFCGVSAPCPSSSRPSRLDAFYSFLWLLYRRSRLHALTP